jgi:hypothetical protein
MFGFTFGSILVLSLRKTLPPPLVGTARADSAKHGKRGGWQKNVGESHNSMKT